MILIISKVANFRRAWPPLASMVAKLGSLAQRNDISRLRRQLPDRLALKARLPCHDAKVLTRAAQRPGAEFLALASRLDLVGLARSLCHNLQPTRTVLRPLARGPALVPRGSPPRDRGWRVIPCDMRRSDALADGSWDRLPPR